MVGRQKVQASGFGGPISSGVVYALFFVLIIFLVGVSAFLYVQIQDTNKVLDNRIGEISSNIQAVNSSVENEISTLNTHMRETDSKLMEINATLINLSKDVANITDRLDTLRSEFDTFEDKYINLSNAYDEKSKEFSALKDDLLSLDEKIKEKMIWFETNAHVNSDEEKELRSPLFRIESKCVHGAYINLPCVVVFLKKAGFSYKSDKKEHIESIDEFITNKGGDCEDWTIFVRSILNRFSDKDLILSKRASGERFEIYQDGSTIWYYPNMDRKRITSHNKKYYGVCYSREKSGHCVLSVGDDFVYDGDAVFEPQTGEYIGVIDSNPNGEGLVLKSEIDHIIYPVVLVITENDINVWDNEKKSWINYNILDERINAMLSEYNGRSTDTQLANLTNKFHNTN